MKYLAAIIISLPICGLPTIGNKSISWGWALVMFLYFWTGIAMGEEIGKDDSRH